MSKHKAANRMRNLDIIKAYEAEHGKQPVSALEIADYALKNKLWDSHKSLRVLCAREMSEAMRHDITEDKYGRHVRKRHSARLVHLDENGDKVQQYLWGDIEFVTRKFMATSTQGRRQQIVGVCVRLDLAVKHFNNLHPEEKPIQVYFNFMNDVEEANLPSEYKPDGDDQIITPASD